MSEHPLIKHGEKTVRAFNKKKGTWPDKLKEILIEILIIVFAISFTLFMERWRENQHDRHLENEFLFDLKQDLTIKMEEFKNDTIAIAFQIKNLNYLAKAGQEEIPFNEDSVSSYMKGVINSYFNLNTNDAFFEALKSSNKVNVISNKELKLNIIGLYQELFPAMQTTYTVFYYPSLQRMTDYIVSNRKIKAGKDNLVSLLKNDAELCNLFIELRFSYKKLIGRYISLIKRCTKLLQLIEKEFPG